MPCITECILAFWHVAKKTIVMSMMPMQQVSKHCPNDWVHLEITLALMCMHALPLHLKAGCLCFTSGTSVLRLGPLVDANQVHRSKCTGPTCLALLPGQVAFNHDHLLVQPDTSEAAAAAAAADEDERLS